MTKYKTKCNRMVLYGYEKQDSPRIPIDSRVASTSKLSSVVFIK